MKGECHVQNIQELETQHLRKREYQEELDRVTAVQHIQTERFDRHVKPEGYYDSVSMGQMFACDRLMKQESMFGRIQLGYNAVRHRTFIFAEMKTSRYDTVSSRYQRTMKEYQMNSRKDVSNVRRAFVSQKRSEASLLIEKAYGKPWNEELLYRYHDRVNEDVLASVMPFLDSRRKRQKLKEQKRDRRGLQEQIQKNTNEGNFEENIGLRQKETQMIAEENLLQQLILYQEAASRNFVNRVNLVYETQKEQIFAYYKHKKKEKQKNSEEAGQVSADDDQDEES